MAALTDKQREQIIEEEKARLQARMEFWREQGCSGYGCYGHGRHRGRRVLGFLVLLTVAGLVLHHLACWF